MKVRNSSSIRWWSQAAAFALSAALLGCSGEPGPDGTPEVVGNTEAAVEGAESAPEPSLVGAVRAVGPAGRSPTEISIRLEEAVFDDGWVGKPVPDATEWSIRPSIEGELRVVAGDQLAFIPDRAFVPGTTYTFAIDAVGSSSDSAHTPREGEVWSAEFSVPEFSLVRVSTSRHDPIKMQAVIDMVFTAHVEPEVVARSARFQMDGRSVRPDRVEAGPLPDTVRFTFLGRPFAADGSLEVELAAGVPARWNKEKTAAAAKESIRLRVGDPVELKAVLVKEGSTGFYVDFVCHDPAAGGERWYWDPDTYDGWWLSARCQPDLELAASQIHVTPSVDFSVSSAPGGFRLFGDFQPGRYEVSIDAGLRTLDGGVLREEWTEKVKVPDRTPRVNFTTKGRYLPKSAWRDLPIQHVNVNMIDLSIRHVPPENLMFWMTGAEPAGARTSNILYKSEVWLQGKKNTVASSWLDMADMLPNPGRGVYQIDIQEKDGGARDSARILLTDMLLVAKLATGGSDDDWSEKAMVWVRDTHTGAGVSGADVSFMRPSGQAVARCRTDGQGGCTLTAPKDPLNNARPIAIVARKGDDLTYLKFADLQLTADSNTGGEGWGRGADTVAYRAALYTDRGVYRPGDTAHVSGILRGLDHIAPEAGLRVQMTVKDPTYNVVREKVLETDASGFVQADVPFHDFAKTGRWTVTFAVGDRSVGSTEFNVEEFVPERMKVTAAAPEGRYLGSDVVPVDISARWLFGGNAKGSRVEMNCTLKPAPYQPPGHPGYVFGLADLVDSVAHPLTLGQVEGELGEEGSTQLACPAASDGLGQLGSAVVVADVSVFEGQSGRTTNTSVRTPVHPAPYYVGVRASADRAESGIAIAMDGKFVTPDGKSLESGVPENVTLTVVRLDEEYGWWWDDSEGSSSYRRLLRRSTVETMALGVDRGAFRYSWTPPDNAAGYLLVFEAGGARTERYLEGGGRRYLWSPRDSSVDQTPKPRKPTPLMVQVPEAARVGAPVTVSVEVPYSGRMLWTVETDRLLEHHWVDVQPGTVDWSFSLDSFEPNVYVTAFLIKDPHLESAEAYIPDRAYGVTALTVLPEMHVREVKLTAPAEVRPYSPLEVTVDVGPLDGPAVLTVAAVDEGILQLTRFESPDPSKTLFAQRRLAVESYETIGWTMLMEPRGASSSTGGDGVGASGRVQMVKPVALWSGPVEVPKSGKVTVQLDVPGYRGELRVMAVVTDAQRVGHADTAVTVRDPLVLTTTLPRFLSRGDIAEIPVMVTNMSGKARDVEVRLQAEAFDPFQGRIPGPAVPDNPIAFVGKDRGSVHLEKGEGATVVFRVRADHAPAAIRFEARAESPGLLSIEKLELPVVADTPTDRRVSRMEVQGDSVDLDALLAGGGWYPGGDTTTFWVTANPYASAMSHLSHVVRYPYGCVEQTSSSTRPLLYVRNLLPSIDPSLLERGSVDDMVKSGVERLMSMQTPSGGFAYWPGGRSPDDWGTAYALHLLLDARDAGFEVSPEALGEAVEWLGDRVDGMSARNVSATTAYMHYVLAKAGSGQPANAAAMLEAVDKPRSSATGYSRRRWDEAEFLLQAALVASGDRRHVDSLKKVAAVTGTNTRSNSSDYYSDGRSRALRLDVLEDLFPGKGLGDALADSVAAGLVGHPSRWYTTQELAWGISSLGKRLGRLSSDAVSAELSVGGTKLAQIKGTSGSDPSWTLRGATALPELSLDVSGNSGPLYLVTTTDGARAVDDLQVGGSGLKISRTWLTSTGEPLKLEQHTLGDRIFVRVDITNTGRSRVSNVAVVDALPAGWEIENPRLSSAARPDWAQSIGTWEVEHMNVRDDRIEAFGSIRGSRTVTLLYAVRAVTSGTFHAPDATAEAMYDPTVWARQPGQEVKIQGPWAGFFL
jgi:uncharacterized repeat protein (TIGR01451 family)